MKKKIVALILVFIFQCLLYKNFVQRRENKEQREYFIKNLLHDIVYDTIDFRFRGYELQLHCEIRGNKYTANLSDSIIKFCEERGFSRQRYYYVCKPVETADGKPTGDVIVRVILRDNRFGKLKHLLEE